MFKKIIFKVSKILGVIFSVFPLIIKKIILYLLGFLTSINLGNKISMWLFVFSREFSEEMMNGVKKEILVSKKNINGDLMILDLSEKTQRLIYFSYLFENPLSRFLLREIKEGDICIDVGANVGYFTVLLSSLVGEKGRVFSFEPEVENFKCLKRNIEVNNMGNVVYEKMAIGDKDGKTELFINPLNRGGNKLSSFSEYKSGDKFYSKSDIEKNVSKNKLSQVVNIGRLDNYINLINKDIKFIKIDVEGHELGVLSGMRDMISSLRIEYILCEVSKSPKEVFNFFRENNFKPFRLDYNGNITELGNVDHGNILFKKI